MICLNDVLDDVCSMVVVATPDFQVDHDQRKSARSLFDSWKLRSFRRLRINFVWMSHLATQRYRDFLDVRTTFKMFLAFLSRKFLSLKSPTRNGDQEKRVTIRNSIRDSIRNSASSLANRMKLNFRNSPVGQTTSKSFRLMKFINSRRPSSENF